MRGSGDITSGKRGSQNCPAPICTSTRYAVCFSSPDNEIWHVVDTIYSGVEMGEVHCLATTEARFKALTEIEKRFSILNILSIEPKSHRMISGNWFIDPSL